jgi:hypothetical protein
VPCRSIPRDDRALGEPARAADGTARASGRPAHVTQDTTTEPADHRTPTPSQGHRRPRERPPFCLACPRAVGGYERIDGAQCRDRVEHSGGPPALPDVVVGETPHHRRLRPDGMDHVEVGVGIRQILPVGLTGVFRPPEPPSRQADRQELPEPRPCPARSLRPRRFPDAPQPAGQPQGFRLNGSPLTLEVTSLAGHYAPKHGRVRRTRGRGGAQPVVTRRRRARGHLRPGQSVMRHLHIIAPHHSDGMTQAALSSYGDALLCRRRVCARRAPWAGRFEPGRLTASRPGR